MALAMGIAASIATIARVVIQILPEESGCAEIAASLERVRVQPNIAFADFLDQANLSSDGYLAKQLRGPVSGIFADVVVDGYRGEHLVVKWSMFDGVTGEIVDDEALRNRPALDIEPSTCRTRLRSAIWIPPVEEGAQRFVRLILVDERGQVLAETRTPGITPAG